MARKDVDEDLNLTPFIDLFSTLVCFLLLTAVWLQVEALSTNVESVTSSDSPDNKKEKVNLTITILPNEIQMAEDTSTQRFPIVVNSEGDLRLDQVIWQLAQWRERHPKRKDVILNTENTVPYRHMIKVFDTLVGEGWPDVGVSTQ